MSNSRAASSIAMSVVIFIQFGLAACQNQLPLPRQPGPNSKVPLVVGTPLQTPSSFVAQLTKVPMPIIVEPSTAGLFELNLDRDLTGNRCSNTSRSLQINPLQSGYSLPAALFSFWMAMRTDAGNFDLLTKSDLSKMGFKKSVYIEKKNSETQVVVAVKDDMAVIAFAGSQQTADWVRDVTFTTQDARSIGLPGWVHSGFAGAATDIYGEIIQALNRFGALKNGIWVTGHSLGGALASLTATRLVVEGYNVINLYTFGQPRVANYQLAAYQDKILGKRYQRIVNDRDPVPRLPPPTELSARVAPKMIADMTVQKGLEILIASTQYKHAGVLNKLDALGTLHAGVLYRDIDDEEFWNSSFNLQEMLGEAAKGAIGDHLGGNYLCKLAINK